MAKKFVLFLCLTVFSIVFVTACSSSDGDATDGDVDGDVQSEQDVDGDSEACVCLTVDACCDGCDIINEGKSCDDSDACTEEDACSNGVCVGAAITIACEDPDACHAAGVCEPATGECKYEALADDTACDDDNSCTENDVCTEGVCGGDTIQCPSTDFCNEDGTCDTETGACVNVNKENGFSCEAIDGQDNSGICYNGLCTGFGDCNHRNYEQPANYPCNLNSECESGMCVDFGNGWNTFCAVACGAGGACPDDMTCATATDLGKICVPNTATDTLPGDGSYDIFDVCNNNEDCLGGLCLAFGSTKFCTKDCEATKGADNSICGDCGNCQDGGIDLNFEFEYYCTPKGSHDTGEACEYSFDCGNRYCFNNYCSEQCWEVAGQSTCPDGFACIVGVVADTIGICIDETELGNEFGEDCEADYQCVSGMCAEVSGKNICVSPCLTNDCSEGTCIQNGVSESVNTRMALIDSEDTELATDENSGEGMFAKIVYSFETAGTYYIKVYGYSTAAGSYMLSVHEGDAANLYTDEVESNDSKESAQALTYPVMILAELESGESDFYSITVTAGTKVEVTMETAAVPLMVCVPDTLVGASAYGEEWKLDYECEDGLECYRNLCTKSCTENTDCPDGECFTYDDEELYCVPDALIGSLATGDACEFAYECEEQCYQDAIFGSSYCSIDCTLDTDCPDDGSMGCFEGLCTKGSSTKIYPYGNCRMNADCESALCVDGKCSEACAENADCELGEAITPVEFGVCWPCATDVDCNDGGTGSNLCITANQVDFFCGTDCYNNPGACPSGTRCYQIDYTVFVCAPVTMSCEVTANCTDAGNCIRPALGKHTPCVEASECISGICENSLCQEGSCTDDVDCACDYLACEGGYCSPAAGSDLAEIEPNEAITNAQALTTFPIKVVASIVPTDTQMDVDLYKVDMLANQALDVETSAFCELTGDTMIRLLNASGTAISGWTHDDINPNTGNFFSKLVNYVSESAQTVYIEVTQTNYYTSPIRFLYMMDVNVFDIITPANNTGAGAIEIAASSTIEASVLGATNDYNPGAAGCAGKELPGVDIVYSLELLSGMYVHIEASAYYFPVEMYLVTDYDDLSTCVASGLGSLSYIEPDAKSKVSGTTYYLIIDAASADNFGSVTIKAELDYVADCAGPCDSSTYERVCTAEKEHDAILCFCTNNMFDPTNCDDLCVDEGGTDFGYCEFVDNIKQTSWCLCDYEECSDATAVSAMCNSGAYNNCTCAAADPCSWKDNTYCDDYCMAAYPGNSFDDSTDCTTEE